MIWNNLFTTPYANISAADVKKFIAAHKPEEYQLIDVRQPQEYATEHIPGAKLIPLAELPERLTELDPGKPTFIY